MAGKIQVASKVDVGTTIRVTLPIELCQVPSEPPKLPRRTHRTDASEPMVSITPRQPSLPMDKLSISDTKPSPPAAASGGQPSPSLAAEVSSEPDFRTGASNATSPAKPFKVLVCDDNVVSRAVLTQLLKKKGVAYEQAADGLEAVEVYKQHHPALVWMDQEMPVTNGTTATELIRDYEEASGLPRSTIVSPLLLLARLSADRWRPQIMLSGLSSEQDIRKGYRAGVDDWMVKGAFRPKALFGPRLTRGVTRRCLVERTRREDGRSPSKLRVDVGLHRSVSRKLVLCLIPQECTELHKDMLLIYAAKSRLAASSAVRSSSPIPSPLLFSRSSRCGSRRFVREARKASVFGS